MMTTTYTATGMTCAHCVSAVTEQLTTLDGVLAVDVDLEAGGESRIIVTSTSWLDSSSVREAVAEAGYQLIGTG